MLQQIAVQCVKLAFQHTHPVRDGFNRRLVPQQPELDVGRQFGDGLCHLEDGGVGGGWGVEERRLFVSGVALVVDNREHLVLGE